MATADSSSKTKPEAHNRPSLAMKRADEWICANPYQPGQPDYGIFEDLRVGAKEELSSIDSEFAKLGEQKQPFAEWSEMHVELLIKKLDVAATLAIQGTVWRPEGVHFFINRYENMAAVWITMFSKSSSMPEEVKKNIVVNLKRELSVAKIRWKAAASNGLRKSHEPRWSGRPTR
jgi:hypothetical protein